MIEFKPIVTQPNYYLNYIMPCLITASSDIKDSTRQKRTNNKISKNKNFTAKTEYLKLKAPGNNI